mgnify:CR=1 FL=1
MSHSDPQLPPRPRLSLRLGFAGRKDLDAVAESHLRGRMTAALQLIARRLAAVAPGVPVAAGREPPIAQFYSTEAPVLRLVTGLCEGADWVAGELLQQVHVAPDGGQARETPCVHTELAAVLPFAVADYRASRPAAFRDQFDQQLARCVYVQELDGLYDKPSPDTALAKQRRARAYRAQGAYLLRHCDLLIAAADPDDAAKAGGTLETLRAALAFELPVLLIHTGTGAVYLIEPDDDLLAVLSLPPAPDWESRLAQWVLQIVADPDVGASVAANPQQSADRAAAIEALREYFEAPPPSKNPFRRLGDWLRGHAWGWLEWLYAAGAMPVSDPSLAPYAAYRKRAVQLNYRYSSLYRGAFVLNYGLAVVAVALATGSLLLLGMASHTPIGEQLLALVEPGAAAADLVSSKPQAWLLPALISMASIKLAIVFFISRSTHRANHERWNDRAVDMRYLAERLRALYYLPRLGSFQPPAVYPPQFAARVVRQSHIDWLCEAIVRGSSPAAIAAPQPAAAAGAAPILRITALDNLQLLRDRWVAQQALYHQRNATTMHSLHTNMERWQHRLGIAVIIVVSIDIALILTKLAAKAQWLDLSPELAAWAKLLTPVLIFLSALIPAAIAALGGLRFQSECQRLAERSTVMHRILAGNSKLTPFCESALSAEPKAELADALELAEGRLRQVHQLHQRIGSEQSGPDNPGSHAHEALRLAERVAEELIQEATEWSVLYAKELGDPG